MTETMTNADNFWLHMDHPTNLMIITGIMEFKERLDYDEARLTLENRLCAFDRFKQRVVMPLSGYGIASWEFDPYFDIRSHFHRVALPGAGGKQELQSKDISLVEFLKAEKKKIDGKNRQGRRQ